MIKTKYILPLIVMSGTFWGCEVEIEPPADDENHPITITALASAGEPLSVRLSWTDAINEALSAPYADSYEMWRVLNFLNESITSHSLMFDSYYKQFVATRATVKAVVDGNEYDLIYNAKTLNYECRDYIAEPGDRITINVQADKSEYNQSPSDEPVHIQSTCTVEVPTHTADVEILKADKVYRELEKYYPLGTVERDVDSVVVFTLRLKSPSPGVNCFRLKVTSLYCLLDDPEWTEYITPISAYHSGDALLYDAAIEKGFGPWPAYQSDVFTDESFNNGEYIINVSSRVSMLGGSSDRTETRYFEIELQPINQALMDYLSVLYRMRVTTPSYFSEPSSIPSNIEGGVGVFGVIGKSKKIRYFLPGEENSAIPPVE